MGKSYKVWPDRKRSRHLETVATAMLRGATPVKGRKKRVNDRVFPAGFKPSRKVRQEFYNSSEWRYMRMEVLKRDKRRCVCCGSAANETGLDGRQVQIHVDHIQPLTLRWDLRLERTNLQCLCRDCNLAKGAWDMTDWRSKDRADEWVETPLSPIEMQLGERMH